MKTCPTCGQPMPKGKIPRPQMEKLAREEMAEETAVKKMKNGTRKPKGK